jgi:hypothetical protein
MMTKQKPTHLYITTENGYLVEFSVVSDKKLTQEEIEFYNNKALQLEQQLQKRKQSETDIL